MKNLTKIFMVVAALVAGFACTTDATEDLGVAVGGQTEFVLSLEETRTQLGEKAGEVYPLYWSDGDKISVNGVESNALSVSENSAVATFTVAGVVNTPYCIAYPAANAGEVVFAAEQSYVEGTFANGASTMYGYSENGGGLQLNHLTGVLKIGVTGDKTLSYAQISTVDRTPIAGAFALDFTNGELTATTSSQELIGYSFGEGVALSSEPTYLHVAVPAGVYNELYVTLYDTEGGVMHATVKANDEKPLAAGKVREFSNSIVYTPNTSVFVVKDAESLKAFAEQASTLEKDVLFVADVDMSGEAWTPIEGYAKNVLGNGYAIKGLTAPLFGTASASIKGLHLVDVAINANNQPVMGALACKLQTTEETIPTIESCSVSGTFVVENTTFVPNGNNTDTEMNYGGLIGTAYGANINNCVNNVAITVNQVAAEGNTAKVRPYVAGVLGCAYYTKLADGTYVYTHLNGCVNNAEILYKDSSCKADNLVVIPVVAGITAGMYHHTSLAESASGKSNVSATFTNCINYGDVTIKANGGGSSADTQGYAQTHAAGVVARGAYTSLKGCYNYGKVTLDGTFLQTYSGGVCGTSWYSYLEDCHNYGEVKMTEKSVFRGAMLAGVSSLNYSAAELAYSTKNCSNNAPISCLGSSDPNAASGGLYHYRIGGVEGFGRSKATGLTNNKEGVITCKGSLIALTKSNLYWNIGGVTAYRTTNGWSDIKNYGDVNVDLTFSIHKDVADDNTKVTDRTMYIGGACGYSSQSAVEGENHGNITVNGTYGGEHLYVGGIGGYAGMANGNKNYGKVTIGDSCQCSSKIFAGGLIGGNDSTSNISNVTNYGDIYVGGSHKASVGIGGIAGQNRSTVSNLENNGNFTVAATSTAAIEVAGIIAYHTHRYMKKATDGSYSLANDTAAGAMTKAVNNGHFYVTTPNSTGGAVNIGGICKQGQHSMIQCVNNGNAFVTGNTGSTLYWGGIVTVNSACLREDCTNNGTITVSSYIGTVAQGADAFLGGLCYSGGSNTTYRRCVNNGDIILTETCKVAQCIRIGGLIANVETSGKLNNIEECANNGDIIVKGASNCGTDGSGVVRIGGMFGQFTNGTVKIINGFKNTGDVIFSGEHKKDIGLSLGGIVGGSDGSVAVWDAASTGNIINEGEIKFDGTSKGAVYMGGFSAFQNPCVPASPVKIINTGNITCTGTPKSNTSVTISGICGNIKSPIANAQCFCDIFAPGYGEAEIGMLSGKVRSAAVTYTNANVGGRICTEVDEEDESEKWVTIDGSNYLGLIYKMSGTPLTEEQAAADGITIISSKDQIDYTVIEVPAAE